MNDDLISRTGAVEMVKEMTVAAWNKWHEPTLSPESVISGLEYMPAAKSDVPDTISRQDIMNVVNEYMSRLCSVIGTDEDRVEYSFARGLLHGIMGSIKEQPIAQRKPGKWVKWTEKREDGQSTEYIPHCKCSECSTQFDPYAAQFMDYCPHCGAQITGWCAD